MHPGHDADEPPSRRTYTHLLLGFASGLVVAGTVAYFATRESDLEKMTRLQRDKDVTCFEASHVETSQQRAHDIDPLQKLTEPDRKRLLDSLVADAAARCGLTTRALNKFMSGR
jgi:hypothetical protein